MSIGYAHAGGQNLPYLPPQTPFPNRSRIVLYRIIAHFPVRARSGIVPNLKIPGEEQANATQHFRQILDGNEITAETILIDVSGKLHYVEFSSTPIAKDGKIIGTRGIVRDITDRKKAEKEVANTNPQLL